MKPKNKEDKYLSEKLEVFDGPIPNSCKKQLREAKRKLKKQISKDRRNREKRDLLKQSADEVQ